MSCGRQQICRHFVRGTTLLIVVGLCPRMTMSADGLSTTEEPSAKQLLNEFCSDCHGAGEQEGGFQLESLFEDANLVGTAAFDMLLTKVMPPRDASQPTESDRLAMLKWIAERQQPARVPAYRRRSRHELVHSLNDLLGVEVDYALELPDDRGTYDYDSDRRIQLTKEALGGYFDIVDRTLEYALPKAGYLPEFIWRTSQLQPSHPTYSVYTRPYEDGILFSWTRANNGNSYSFFYDGFEPPASGWYELTFEAAKVGSFPEDVSIQVHAGKYYFADDRPQPQRLVDVVSLNKKDVGEYTVRAWLNPGESVSVHCFSPHTWRMPDTKAGAYIRQLRVRGPIKAWPTLTHRRLFQDLPLVVPERDVEDATWNRSNLEAIGGKVSVSSSQQGMGPELMLDRSDRTFWHTRFEPTLADSPHYVVFENPRGSPISGLVYSTWTGGNDNGQIKSFEVYTSENGREWGGPIASGDLERGLPAEQPIPFGSTCTSRFIKFLITDAYSIDGRSLASIGRLDVIVDRNEVAEMQRIEVRDPTSETLHHVLRRFAERAFATPVTEEMIEPFLDVSVAVLDEHDDFDAALKVGLKAMLCSDRFLYRTDETPSDAYRIARDLAATLWLSVPDDQLLRLIKGQASTDKWIRQEVERMLTDDRSSRMIEHFCGQWLNLRTFKQVSPSLKLYPLYDDLLEHYLPLETETFFRAAVLENRPVTDLIDSDYGYLNQRLAEHYGIEGLMGQELRRVAWPEDSPRGGLMTMGSILKVTTDGFQTSPILRGAWISERIAGNSLSPPPENVKAIESDTSGATNLRERIELHKSDETCAACHQRIDPYGFALEAFDATGQLRQRYREQVAHPGTFQYRRSGYYTLADPVDTAGELDGRTFEGPSELKEILVADHKKVAMNLMQHFFEYTAGYAPTLRQRLALYQTIPDEASSCRIRDLLVETLVIALGEPR